MRAPDKIGNVNNSIAAVINKDHGNKGIVLSVNENNLKLNMVTQKFKEVRHELTPDIKRPIQR
jgi:hypothetical protein